MGKVRRAWENYLGLWDRLTGKKRVLFYLFHYTVLFLVTFLLAYSPFWLAGKTLIWSSDGRKFHYPILVYIGRYLRQVVLHLLHGEIAIPLFDLNLMMGSDIIGTMNIAGFGNPLYLLSAFVPTHYIEYLYNFLIVLRLYLAGLSFLALCKYHKKEFAHALIGALVYVFSGYAILSAVRHPYFTDPMVLFPLLLIGIDLVIQKKKPLIFILSVFCAALCGFYFLYMMTIMLGFYALIRFFDCYKESRGKNFLTMVGRIVGTYSLGIGLSAPIFFPAVFGFLTSGRSGEFIERNYLSYGWKYYKNNLLKLIAPPGTWNALALAAIVLLALVALFIFSKRSYRSLKLLLAVSAVFFVLPLGGYAMNGFSYPSQRWTFGAALLLSYILVEMLPDLLRLDRKQQLVCFTVFLLYTLIVFLKEENRTAYHVVGVAMLAGTLLVLCLFGEKSGSSRRVGAIVCVGLVLFNVSINAVYKFSKNHANYTDEFAAIGTETKRLETAIEREMEPYSKKQEGRFDGVASGTNAGTIWRIPMPRGYWSIVSSPITEFGEAVENVEMTQLNLIYGIDKRTGLEALFSTKYLIEKKDDVKQIPYGYSVINETKKENLIYENQYALPWGYTYDSYISSAQMEAMNGLVVEEAMLQSVVLEEEVNSIPKGFIETDISEIFYEVEESKNIEWENGVLTVKKDNAFITLNFHMPADVEGYIRLQGFDINNSGQASFNVTVKCGDISQKMFASSTKYNWFWGRESYLANLGYSEEERTICTITFPKKGTYKLEDIQLFALSMDNYPNRIETLREEPLENIEFGPNRIAGTVDLTKNKILCMSIPYSKGWTAKVDGKRTEVLKGNYMFMALPLTEGHHEIEFTYCSPGLRLGIAVSVICFLGLLICYKKRERRYEKN